MAKPRILYAQALSLGSLDIRSTCNFALQTALLIASQLHSCSLEPTLVAGDCRNLSARGHRDRGRNGPVGRSSAAAWRAAMNQPQALPLHRLVDGSRFRAVRVQGGPRVFLLCSPLGSHDPPHHHLWMWRPASTRGAVPRLAALGWWPSGVWPSAGGLRLAASAGCPRLRILGWRTSRRAGVQVRAFDIWPVGDSSVANGYHAVRP